ncbi:MAG: YkgJ family cysteine cluster protein [Xanthomonadales bacterium]|nr:YkgJ family cysteine cluster protein [Xanthomonadales bacterium]
MNLPAPDEEIDHTVACSACDAVCCRLTVVVMPSDDVPRHLVDRGELGLEVMAQNEEGWCLAIDPLRLDCTIYARRPAICREFAMGSRACRAEREDYRAAMARAIPLRVV